MSERRVLLLPRGGGPGPGVMEIARRRPMRRLGRPEEAAATAAFLFSEGSGYFTAQVISIDGGIL